MAKKKKVLTDNDYEEFNKWMTEQESKPTPSLRMFQSWFVGGCPKRHPLFL